MNHTSTPLRGRQRKLMPRKKLALTHMVANCGIKIAVEATRIINLEREDRASRNNARRALEKMVQGQLKG